MKQTASLSFAQPRSSRSEQTAEPALGQQSAVPKHHPPSESTSLRPQTVLEPTAMVGTSEQQCQSCPDVQPGMTKRQGCRSRLFRMVSSVLIQLANGQELTPEGISLRCLLSVAVSCRAEEHFSIFEPTEPNVIRESQWIQPIRWERVHVLGNTLAFFQQQLRVDGRVSCGLSVNFEKSVRRRSFWRRRQGDTILRVEEEGRARMISAGGIAGPRALKLDSE